MLPSQSYDCFLLAYWRDSPLLALSCLFLAASHLSLSLAPLPLSFLPIAASNSKEVKFTRGHPSESLRLCHICSPLL